MTLLADLYTPDILGDGYAFSDSSEYVAPVPSANLSSHVNFVKALPAEDAPWLFGLHENASVAAAMSECGELCATALLALPQVMTSSAKLGEPADATVMLSPLSASPTSYPAASPTSLGPLGSGTAAARALRPQSTAPHDSAGPLASLVSDLLTQLPSLFDAEGIAAAHPPSYAHSMNVMLAQETTRYNRLLTLVASSLSELKDAVNVSGH